MSTTAATQNPLSDAKTIAPLAKYHSVNPFNDAKEKDEQLKGFSNDGGEIPISSIPNATQSIVSQYILQAGQRPVFASGASAELENYRNIIKVQTDELNAWTLKYESARNALGNCPSGAFGFKSDCQMARSGDMADATGRMNAAKDAIATAKADLDKANQTYTEDLAKWQAADTAWMNGLTEFIKATANAAEKLNESDPTLQKQKIESQQRSLEITSAATTAAQKEKNKKLIIVLIIVTVLVGVLGTAAYFLIPQIKE